jgi:hypothetical protein
VNTHSIALQYLTSITFRAPELAGSVAIMMSERFTIKFMLNYQRFLNRLLTFAHLAAQSSSTRCLLSAYTAKSSTSARTDISSASGSTRQTNEKGNCRAERWNPRSDAKAYICITVVLEFRGLPYANDADGLSLASHGIHLLQVCASSLIRGSLQAQEQPQRDLQPDHNQPR